MTSAVARERKRCAKIARDIAVWCYNHWQDQPTQWIRCEQIMLAIDPKAKRISEADRKVRKAEEKINGI